MYKKTLTDSQKIKVFIFGSRARGDFKRYSDIDLLIEVNPSLNRAQIRQLKDLFEESDLPYKVDLVLEEELLDEFRGSVEKEKTPL